MPPFRFNMPSTGMKPMVPQLSMPAESDLSAFGSSLGAGGGIAPLERADNTSPKVPFPAGAAMAWSSGQSQGGFGGFQAPSEVNFGEGEGSTITAGAPEPDGDEIQEPELSDFDGDESPLGTLSSNTGALEMPEEVVPGMEEPSGMGSMMGPPEANAYGGNERSSVGLGKLAMGGPRKPMVPRY